MRSRYSGKSRLRIPPHLEGQLERNGFAESFLLENARADELTAHLRHHEVFPRFENVDLRHLGLLVNLFGLQLVRLGEALLLRLLVSVFQKDLFKQFRIVEALWIALQKWGLLIRY